MKLQIENRYLSDAPGAKPFIIAEMSGNHNQSLDTARQIVEAPASAGVDAIKLQTYTADTMTMEGVHRIDDEESLWHGEELHALYQKACTPWDWHAELFERARELGLVPFSSPFDATAVDFLEDLNVGLYKIASFENTDLPLLKKVAGTGKPVIVSTGSATVGELHEAVETLRSAGCPKVILLKCTSTYPASPANSHLRTIPHMRELFGCHVGLSDHTLGIGVAVAAVALGARVVEKHFVLNRADGGVDAAFSLEPQEMAALVAECGRASEALGTVRYTIESEELKSRFYKRSIFVAADVGAGQTLTAADLRVLRPALGIQPKHLEVVLGRRVKRDLPKGSPLQWEDLQ